MFVVKLFFGNRSIVLIFLPIIIGLYYLCNDYSHYHTSEQISNFGFWGKLDFSDHSWFNLLGPLLVFINAITLNTLFNRNEFMERNNFLTSLLYVCFLSFFHSFYYLEGLSIAQTLIILSLNQLVKLNQNDDGRKQVFNASILFGLACTVYPVLLIGIPFLFWMIWVVRPFVIRESALIITGFILPLFYAGLYNYVFKTQFERNEFSSSFSENHLIDMIVLCVGVTFILLFSVKGVLNKIGASTIRLKKLFKIILLLIALTLGISLLEIVVFSKSEVISLMFIPVLIFLPYAFGIKEQRVVPTLLFYLIFFFSVSKFFIPFDSLAF